MLTLLTCLGLTLRANYDVFTINTTSRTLISPYIYGANFPDWANMGEIFTMARQGGNRMTAYNWENNASNAGADYHNQNDNYMGATDEPGWTGKTFLQANQPHHAATLITVPTEGYVAADKNPPGDVNQTPDYLNVRFVKSYAHKPTALTYPPDLNDHAVYQDEFVAYMEKIKSPATPVWYALDNEPDIWASTHSRICLKAPTYADIIANNTQFATAIKGVAPNTLVFGPANYGWEGFRTFQNASDANGRIFLDVYLAAMNQAQKQAGKRLLDVLDIHWYPEAKGDGQRITDSPDKPGSPAAREQAPRSLWDPTYVEDSWIAQSLGNKPIVLLPDILSRIANNYPGTKLGITEYNYGGGAVISGAIAQADVLGIFGRYGLFAACNWGISASDIAQQAGFRAFTNYDGKGSRFGSDGLLVTGGTVADDSVYASTRGHDIILVAINKTNAPKTMRFNFTRFRARGVTAYAITSNTMPGSAVVPASTSRDGVDFVAPAQSVTTLEVHS